MNCCSATLYRDRWLPFALCILEQTRLQLVWRDLDAAMSKALKEWTRSQPERISNGLWEDHGW
jgi:hypothetical protein